MDAMAEAIRRAADVIAGAESLLIAAGAGMGVDSGLPDFRGVQGFWRAYPAFAELGLGFEELANPQWFDRDPPLAWGFYGHRLNLYRATIPHEGFGLVRRWAEGKGGGHFVFTSNVDGHFQKAGFAEGRIVECHGSIHHLQCVRECSDEIWPAEELIDIDPRTMRARGELPRCRACGGLARPNILMFEDWAWLSHRTDGQAERCERWVDEVRGKMLAIIECGAGLAVPTVRRRCERLAAMRGATLIRINVRDSEAPSGQIRLPMGALAAQRWVDRVLSGA